MLSGAKGPLLRRFIPTLKIRAGKDAEGRGSFSAQSRAGKRNVRSYPFLSKDRRERAVTRKKLKECFQDYLSQSAQRSQRKDNFLLPVRGRQ
jgi:hypothetical protein